MSKVSSSFEKFLAKAVAVLQTTENSLQELAQAAFLAYQQEVSAQENGHEAGNGLHLRLQQIGRQLSALSEHSKTLHTYLQNNLDALPIDNEQWPQIRILQSQEEERMQVARSLEDSVGQLLANTIFELASCQQLLGHDDLACARGLEGIQTELEHGLASFRHFITELDPTTVLSNFGLGGGIRRYLEQFEVKTGLKTQLRINTNFGRLPTMIEIAIFRIIEEALNNVHRHARATQVDVKFDEQEGLLQFSITDDGNGLNSEKIGTSRRSLGLARMIDYAELLNGKLRILSEPGQGTQVILEIPYPAL